MRRAALLLAPFLAQLLSGCGEAVFTPECQQPSGAELARPIDIAPLGNDTFAVLNADPDELFCGGFVSILDGQGDAKRDPALVDVKEGFEANFASMATTSDRIWLAGRRYGYLIGMSRADLTVDIRIPEVFADRIFAAGPDHLVAWTSRTSEPQLIWYDKQGNELLRQATARTPLRATAYDPKRQRVWLALQGSSNIQSRSVRYVDLPNIQNPVRKFPKGIGTNYTIVDLALHKDIVYGADIADGTVLAWDAESGEPVAASSIGDRPKKIRTDPLGRLWVLDNAGGLFFRRNDEWTLLSSAFERPVAFSLTGNTALVLDFELQSLSQVTAP